MHRIGAVFFTFDVNLGENPYRPITSFYLWRRNVVKEDLRIDRTDVDKRQNFSTLRENSFTSRDEATLFFSFSSLRK